MIVDTPVYDAYDMCSNRLKIYYAMLYHIHYNIAMQYTRMRSSRTSAGFQYNSYTVYLYAGSAGAHSCAVHRECM